MSRAIIIVDHGSRSPQSNRLLDTLIQSFAARFGEQFPIVEPAHMELCDPTIADAFDRCARRGASSIIVCPLFLAMGKHMQEDIPRLVADAAAKFPAIDYRIAAPLGADELVLDLLHKRARECALA
jgi:sirohydrochlorin ferrochelatase